MLLSHLHADHCLDLCGYYVHAQVPPERPAAARSRSGGRADTADRMARAYDLPRGPGHDARSSTSGRYAGTEFDHRAVHRRARSPVEHPVEAYGLRVTRGRRARSPTPATPGRATGSTGWPPAPTCCSPRRRSAHGDDNPPEPPPHRHRLRRGRRAAPASAGWCITHVPPWYDPQRRCSPRPQAVWDGPAELARAGRDVRRSEPDLDQAGVVDADRDLHPVGDLRACRRAGTRAPSRSAPRGGARARSRRCSGRGRPRGRPRARAR